MRVLELPYIFFLMLLLLYIYPSLNSTTLSFPICIQEIMLWKIDFYFPSPVFPFFLFLFLFTNVCIYLMYMCVCIIVLICECIYIYVYAYIYIHIYI